MAKTETDFNIVISMLHGARRKYTVSFDLARTVVEYISDDGSAHVTLNFDPRGFQRGKGSRKPL